MMILSTSATLLIAGLISLPTVLAHGYVKNIIINGQTYTGWLADSYPYITNPPATIGWKTTVTDNGFVAPDAFTSQDIICHRGGAPGSIGATVSAGSTIQFEWNTWPDSHKGPIMNYLAKANAEDWSSVNKASLSFVKISQSGYISGSNPGTWTTDTMIANGFKTSTTLPSNIAPGKYVLRHEIIALHSAFSANGAQSYPQCINIEVTGGGSASPSGTSATSFYHPTDPGILFNLYSTFSSYPYPGPAVYSG